MFLKKIHLSIFLLQMLMSKTKCNKIYILKSVLQYHLTSIRLSGKSVIYGSSTKVTNLFAFITVGFPRT